MQIVSSGEKLPRAFPCTISEWGTCKADTSLHCGSCETLNEREMLGEHIQWQFLNAVWTFTVLSHLGGHTRVFLCTCSCTLVALCHRRWAGTRQWAHSDTSARQNLQTEESGSHMGYELCGNITAHYCRTQYHKGKKNNNTKMINTGLRDWRKRLQDSLDCQQGSQFPRWQVSWQRWRPQLSL